MLPDKNETCKGSLLQFDRLNADIKRDNDLLSTTTTSSRVRRGALNFVGNVANALFGVLDDEYANHMSTTINTIKQDEGHIVTLIRNQTSIIDATINIIKANEQETSSRFDAINENLKQFAGIVNDIRQQYHNERLRQLFNSIALQLLLVSSQFQRTQASLIDVMIDTHHGRINPQLISPIQLKQEFTRIKANLPSSVRLPVSAAEVPKLYHLMSIHGKALKEHIIFKIELPLLSLDEFELFKVTPVPVLVGKSFFAIQPSTEYIMINLHRDQYYPLSTLEFHGCFSITEERHLCHMQRPIYRRGSEVSSCEINFLNHVQQSPACKVVKANDGPHWVQLHNPNEWIYALRVKTTLNIVCNSTSTQTVLEGSGILQIQPDCVLKDDFITLRGHLIQRTISRMSLSPAINLSEYSLPDDMRKISYGDLPYKKHLKELNALKQELINITKVLPSITHHNDVHHFTVGYTGLITSIIILICLIRWSYCHYRKRNNVAPNAKTNTSTTSAKIQGDYPNPSTITFEMMG
ncbi:uncharacterized protein LOC129908485 [Episyrphus balteatus]|uniref:uncharacterized protein LOC129908485 n=1 Tax=Episyrphus balteatus TaxID=286459 RepID=UPI00248629C7|nr:uncharacterized protein LOC129908485 [Episyrphus balteatus]